MKTFLLIAITCLALLASARSALAQPFDLSWNTIDGGGGTSTGDSFSLSGTIGQPDAGVMSGGGFSIRGGFWVGEPVNACKPNRVTDTGCLGPVDLLAFLNVYFTDYDGFGSAVPATASLPTPFAQGGIYAVPCSPAQQSAVPPVVPAAGLKADYDGDCQISPTDLLTFLNEYFNPVSACFSGCGFEAKPNSPASPPAASPSTNRNPNKSSRGNP